MIPSTTGTPPFRIGRYEVQRELGRGAMGVVYEATDPLLGRTVALKTIRLVAARPDERALFEQRFFSEARAAARLQHPGIVVVHDIGQDPETADLFIALEYLRGRTLNDAVAEQGAFPWREALRIVQRLASALHHAHENGIVHRDVKPDNVMLLENGEPKLMDFGIARVETARLTLAGQIFGTPRYMSPEQALGEPADARSDLFALGSVAYFLLTGQHAFGAPTIPLIITQVVQEDPAAPSALTPGLPAHVESLLGRMLAKKPSDRYPDGRSIVEDVEDVLASRPPTHASAVTPRWRPADGETLLSELVLVEDGPPDVAQEAVATSVAAPPGIAASRGPTAASAAAPRRWRSLAVAAGVALVGLWLLWPVGAAPSRTAETPTTPPERAAAPGVKGAPARETAPPAEPTSVRADEPGAPAERSAATGDENAAEEPVPEGSARVRFRLQHSIREGEIEISVDDDVVFEDDLEGRTRRKLRFIKTSKGSLETNIDVAPGERKIRVEVRWDDEVKARTVSAEFEPGQTRRLDAKLGGFLRKSLSLEMR